MRLRRNTSLDSIAPLVLGFACATSSCVHVDISYRDVGGPDAYARDAARPDAWRPDADLDAPDPSTPDSADLDAFSTDAPLPMGDDGTRAVLSSIGERVILAALSDFEVAAEALVTATARASSTGSAEDREAARAAWRAAMASWQHIEMLQAGPAGLAIYTLGGRGLRDEIHPWPLVSYCSIDQNTVEATYADVTALGATAVSARGLSAIEYTLFEESGENRCGATSVINTSGSWAALGADEVGRRRLSYAHNAAVIVRDHAHELRVAWDPTGEDFLGTLRTAGAGSTLYTSAQSGLNALSDALFFLYKEVTDNKLGTPAGLYVDCPTASCPDHVESPFAHTSLDNVRRNLEAFRDAYLGASPPAEGAGFDDLLRARGAADLDLRVRAALDVAFAAFEPIEGPLEIAVDTDHADVVALHDAIRALADLFKMEVLTVLDLTLPNRVEGDND
ncbi:MAG: imelysin family protein [Sandaracinaceae bacterium]|nr:imelysin family protein [Sandaracinaceae bacterium]